MKRYWFASISMLMVLFIAGGGLFFWQQINKETTMTVSKVKRVEDGRVIIGLDPNYAPMEFSNADGKMVGFDIDLIKAAFAQMGESYELRPIPWDKKTELLNSGEIDLIWSGLNISDERKKLYEFSIPYIKSEQIIIVSTHSDVVIKSQLANKRIGIPKGSFTMPILQEFSKNNPEGEFASITEFGSLPEAMVAILTGDIDVVIGDNVVGRYYTSNSLGQYRILSEPFLKGEGMAVAAKKGSKERINKINKTLTALTENGTLPEIHTQWFGK